MFLLSSQNSTPPADHYVNVRGYKTRYWDIGFSDSVVILIHGFGLSCDIWQGNIEELAKSHRVIALDFWGYGKTDATPQKINIKQYPEFIVWFMDALKIKHAKLVGHSLGGLITLRVASNYPEYVEKIMLVGSAGFTKGVPWYFRLFTVPFLGELIAKVNRKNLKRALAQNIYRGNISDSLINSLFEYTQKPHAIRHSLNLLRSGMNFLGFRSTVIRQIQRETQSIQCPVFVLWGKNDRILNYRGAFRAKKLMPQARVEVLEKCGHLPQLEYPTRFNELVLSFL